MRKFMLILLAILMAATVTGCNQAMGLGNLTFEKVHVDTYHYSGCFTVEKWHDNSTGIEVKTKEAGSLFLSEGTYILLSGDEDCPFCKGGDLE